MNYYHNYIRADKQDMVRKLLLSLLKVVNKFGYKLVKIHDKAFEDQFLFVDPKDDLVIFDIGSNVGDTVQKYTHLKLSPKLWIFRMRSSIQTQMFM